MRKILSIFLVSTLSLSVSTNLISCSAPTGKNYDFLLKGEPRPAYDSQTKFFIEQNAAREIADNIWKQTKPYREKIGWPSTITEDQFINSNMVSVLIDDANTNFTKYKNGTRLTLKTIFKSKNYSKSNYFKDLIKNFWKVNNQDRSLVFDTPYYLNIEVRSFNELRTILINKKTIPSDNNWRYNYNFNNVTLGNIDGSTAKEQWRLGSFNTIIEKVKNIFIKKIKSYQGIAMTSKDKELFKNNVKFDNKFNTPTQPNYSCVYYNNDFINRYYINKQPLDTGNFIYNKSNYEKWLLNGLLTSSLDNKKPTFYLGIFANISNRIYNDSNQIGNYIDQIFSVTSPLYFASIQNIFDIIVNDKIILKIPNFTGTWRSNEMKINKAWQKTPLYQHLINNYNFKIELEYGNGPENTILKCTWPDKTVIRSTEGQLFTITN